MPRLRTIPEPARAGLKYLMTISDEAFHELVNGLKDARPHLTSADYLTRLIPNTTVVTREEASAIVDAAFSMSTTYVVNDVPIEQFVQDVADALERGLVKDIAITDGTRQPLVERLSTLLNLNVFRVGVKATSVLNEQQHTLSRARILTDIRPIFGDNVADAPVGVTLVHTLKIKYREGEEIKEFFVAMDTRDVQLLMDVLERAKTKGEGLKALLSAAAINLIDYS